MKFYLNRFNALVISLIIFNIHSFSQENIATKNIIPGNWAGSLEFMGKKLQLVFKISFSPENGFKATFDSPDQGATNIAFSSVNLKNDSLFLEAKQLRASYSGKIDLSDTSITGQWNQSGISLPLHLKKTEKTPVLSRPQEPQPPFPYLEEKISFENTAAGVKLAGTLTIPKGPGPFASCIMITGSGPQNRDEEIFGHKPFLVIADHLSRNGIAVLRYDDRGTAESTGNFAGSTTLDFTGDAKAAIDFLSKDKRFDPGKIGLIGHSEGGIIAPILASQDTRVDFIVLLAGPGLTGEEILILQTGLISKALGEQASSVRQQIKENKKIYRIVKKEPDNDKATVKLKKLITAGGNKQFEKLPDSKGTKEAIDQAIDAQIKQVISPWFRTFLVLDPRDYLCKVHCPVLALNGEKDMQVPPEKNLKAIQKALAKAGNKNVRTMEIKGLNHLFQTAKTGSPDEYGTITETFSPMALQEISRWILETIENTNH